MEIFKLSSFTKGWFLGNFEPSIIQAEQFEVAVKNYSKGDYEPKHYHKIAKEITVILKGKVKMNDNYYYEGDMILISPFETTDFFAETKCQTAVVKIPSVKNDKYIVGE
jgi:quercetin dioxygenase-like cupin family protein